MKNGLLILLLALAAGTAAFWVTRSHQHPHDRQTVLLDSMPELAWLRTELNLTDAQFARACALHTAYRPQCVRMCRRIADARAPLAHHARSITPELATAIRELARVRAECQEQMLDHLYQTAALLDGPQAALYLARVLPHALEPPADAAPSCQHP